MWLYNQTKSPGIYLLLFKNWPEVKPSQYWVTARLGLRILCLVEETKFKSCTVFICGTA